MKNLDLEKIIELDEHGYSLKEIAQIFDTYYQNIQKFLTVNNYTRKADKHRIFKINDSYFKNIDTEIKSYLLGYFAADGGILKDGRLMIGLSEPDKQIIELFTKELGLNKEIEICNVQSKGVKFRQTRYQIRFKSYEMLKDLEKFGIKYKKSLNEMTFINIISKELQHHFIRGYFDGDGCISRLSSNGITTGYMCSFSNSTSNILHEISLIMASLNISNRLWKPKVGSYFQLYTCNTKHVCEFGDYMYKDAVYFLSRKKEKFDNANTVLTHILKRNE